LPDWDPQADCGTGMAGATESASISTTADTTDSDGATLPDGTSLSAGVTLADGITLLEGSALDPGAGDLVGRIGNPSHVAFADLFPRGSSPEASDADVVPNGGDEMGQRGENNENVTNEAKSIESVSIIQNKATVDVAANSGVDAGLDSGPESLEVGRGKQELNADILASLPGAAELLQPHLPRSP